MVGLMSLFGIHAKIRTIIGIIFGVILAFGGFVLTIILLIVGAGMATLIGVVLLVFGLIIIGLGFLGLSQINKYY